MRFLGIFPPGGLLNSRMWRISCQKRIRVLRVTQETINSVVKVMRRPDRVAGVPDIPKDGSLIHKASGLNIAEFVEVSVIVPLPARTQDTNNVTSQIVFPNLEDHTVGCADNRAAQRREDVDTFVTSIAAARSAPSVGQIR
jgi:hypothetical protein